MIVAAARPMFLVGGGRVEDDCQVTGGMDPICKDSLDMVGVLACQIDFVNNNERRRPGMLGDFMILRERRIHLWELEAAGWRNLFDGGGACKSAALAAAFVKEIVLPPLATLFQEIGASGGAEGRGIALELEAC